MRSDEVRVDGSNGSAHHQRRNGVRYAAAARWRTQGRTLAEIGAAMGVSRERARYICAVDYPRLRRRLHAKRRPVSLADLMALQAVDLAAL